MQDLVCISHLRWDFVWQRPQHLLSRFAQHYRVLFVEEPVSSETATEPTLNCVPFACPGGSTVHVAHLVYPTAHHRWVGHGDAALQPVYSRFLSRYLKQEGYRDPVLWLYTPMALDFADTIRHKLLVYDVMDQLSAFQGAPVELSEREELLLQRADLVFTGGVSLYRAKSRANANTHLFPSGVEREFFGQAARPESLECPAELVGMQGPILGYFGVIDERMDLPLLALLAESRPDWQIVLVGPVAKIASRDLPRHPNLHYLGKKSYTDLPAYLARFDVALIPFALNAATEYLSPTKTLEYMAAHKPIVSTPIRDVMELYGEVVRIGHTPAEFLAQVERALDGSAAREAQRGKEDQLLAKYAWDHIAQQMQHLVTRQVDAASRPVGLRKTARQRAGSRAPIS